VVFDRILYYCKLSGVMSHENTKIDAIKCLLKQGSWIMNNSDFSQVGFSGDGNLFNVISAIVQQAIAKISTVRAVKIVAAHLPNNGEYGQIDIAGTLDVQLLTKQMDGKGKTTKRGIVYGIPYHRLQTGDSAHVVDPQVGDIGLAHIGDRDLSANIAARGEAQPGSTRRFSPSDSIYYGGILNNKPKQYLTWTKKGTEWGDRNKNRHTMHDKGMTHTDGVNEQSRVWDKNGITDNTKKTHTINATTSNIQANVHNIQAITNIPNLLKVANVAQATKLLGGLIPGGSSVLNIGKNFIQGSSPIPIQIFVMPTVDVNGNSLSDGIGMSISFGADAPQISWNGSFAVSPPTAVTAGQVLNFSWSGSTQSWWNG
jgi:hypothetical protein